MSRRVDLAITPAILCPATRYTRPHTVVLDDRADLVDYGTPDHGVTVRLGRCRHCTAALLAIDPYMSDHAACLLYEMTGARL